jgi:hypothetical protein
MNRSTIESMSLADLAALYNSLRPESPVKKFSDRKTAVRRVLAAVEEAEAAKAAATPAEPATQPEAAPRRRSGPRKPRTVRHVPTGPEKAPRPGTKRADLLAALLGGGMTIEEMQSRFGWQVRDCRDALALLAKHNGYVTYLGEDGRWHAAAPETDRTNAETSPQGPRPARDKAR